MAALIKQIRAAKEEITAEAIAEAKPIVSAIVEVSDAEPNAAVAADAPTPKVVVPVVIEDNIPMPEGKPSKQKYPWSELAVSQSFFVAGAAVATFYTLCTSAAKRHEGRKFIARKFTGPEGVEGVRVWRTA